MKDKIKRLIIIEIMILIISIMLATVCTANSSSFKATTTANKTELKPGEEITITLSISDINMGEKGINTIEGKIEYNKDIFEEIKNNSVQSLNNWTTTYNDESSNLNGKFLSANLGSGIKENTQVFKVTLKAKEGIKNTTDTQINFKNITSNDETNLVSAGTKSVNVKINSTSENKPTTEEPKKENTTKEIVSTTDKTQSAKKIPKTGKSVAMFFVVVLTLIAIIILGIKNINMRDIK